MTRQRGLLLGLVVCAVAAAPAAGADYWVSALFGSNTTGNGSQGSPWKSITFANASTGTPPNTIHVMDGVYNTANGETFPIALRAGTTLKGASPWRCVLDAGRVASVLQLSSSVTVQALTIRGSARGWWSAAIEDWTGSSSWQVEGCHITDAERGINSFGAQAPLIRNNFLVNLDNDAISLFRSSNVVVINNTSVGNLKGMILADDQGLPTTGYVVNNIFQGNTGGPLGRLGAVGIDMSPLTAQQAVLIKNNVYGNTLNYGGAATPGPTDISVDSLFVNQALGDVHLTFSSPCLNVANTTRPETPPYDFDGSGRPYGGNHDLGADELVHPNGSATPGDLYSFGEIGLGRTIRITGVGNGSALYVLALSPLLSPAPIPTPIGNLYLDVGSMAILFVTALNPSGLDIFPITVPTSPSLQGVAVYWQAYVDTKLTEGYLETRIH